MSRAKSRSRELDPTVYRKVFVIYTGGTIGMKNEDGVLKPVPDYLEKSIRTLPMFYDVEKAAQLGFKNEVGQPLVLPATLWYNEKQSRLKNLSSSHKSLGKKNKSTEAVKYVVYKIKEYNPLLDSSNMTMKDWIRIATDIKTEFNNYDAFVVLHGTDTMAYTASALSFMFENLSKPVIVTGSQIPIYETRSDGRDNFLDALVVAGNYSLDGEIIPEVTIMFYNQLMRGNRTIKQDAEALFAFNSPNFSPLMTLGVNITVNWDEVLKPESQDPLEVQTQLCENVGVLRFFPSITLQTVKNFLQPPMEGVVLQTYGAGNGPDSRQDLLDLFKEKTDNGMLIVNTTQCMRGMVITAYATGQALLDAGIIPGSDLTPEAALTKLAYVIAKDWTHEVKKEVIGKSIRGEMTPVPSEDGEA